MDEWDLTRLPWKPHHPEVLSSVEEGRAIVVDLPADELLQDHQVHEGAWITVVGGGVAITAASGEKVSARAGFLLRLAPRERHEVKAVVDSRILLLLTPWPGLGHPGTMSLEEKAHVRERAAERGG